MDAYRDAVGSVPIARSGDYTLYLAGRTLTYLREPCVITDDPRFFLHVFPVDAADLPPNRMQHGFTNHDFPFWDHIVKMVGGWCMIVRELPDYRIASIQTGQFEKDVVHWSVDFDIPAERGN